jgi:hypothetical protein
VLLVPLEERARLGLRVLQVIPVTLVLLAQPAGLAQLVRRVLQVPLETPVRLELLEELVRRVRRVLQVRLDQLELPAQQVLLAELDPLVLLVKLDQRV